MDLETAIELFFAERWDMSQTTVDAYRNHYSHFQRYIGNPGIDKIDPSQIKMYLKHAHVDLGLSRRTCSDHWVSLSSLFSWCESELNVKHPIRGLVKRPGFNKKPIEILTDDECKLLIKFTAFTTYTRGNGTVVTMRRATAVRDKAIIVTMLDVALRVSEVCNLRVCDWNAKTARLAVVDGKGQNGGKSRNVYVGNSCKSAIMRYLAYRGKVKKDDPLFATTNNKPLARSNIRNILDVVARQAGIRQTGKGVYPHLLRHTSAVNFLRSGGSLRHLQDLMGHSSLKTLEHYLHLAEVDARDASKFSPADRMRL